MADDFTPKLVIGSPGGEHVSVQPTRREFPETADYWDGNWVYADVEVRAGSFRGKYEALLRTDEFARFRTELGPLYENLTGTASFESMEEWLKLRLTGDGKGHIEVACEAKDAPGIGNLLSFSLEIDQTDLPRNLSEIDAILRKFPVTGDPQT